MALLRMFAASVISTMNVDRPPARSSPAPMRVKMRSMGPSTARSAGTKLPTCASSTMSAPWRMYVDLPPMLGPVTISMRRVASSTRSLGTNAPSMKCSTTGWRPPRISRRVSATSFGSVQPSAAARSASAARQSSDGERMGGGLQRAEPVGELRQDASYNSRSRASDFSRAPSTLSSKLLSSGVMKRSAFFTVCRRM